jgi:hypothetical protein
MHIWHITFFGNSGHEKNSSYWYRIYFRFCVRKLFFEDSYLAHDHGTIRQYFFIAIAAWWRSYFSPTSRQNSLLFRCERISSLISLLQIICIRMQCWLDDRVYFICRDSLQAIGEEGQRGRKRTKNIEILSHLHQRGIEEGACESHFIVFSDRWVKTQFCLFLFESWCERQHFLLVRSMHSLVYILYNNWKLLCRLMPIGIETRSIFHAPHWCHRYICRKID